MVFQSFNFLFIILFCFWPIFINAIAVKWDQHELSLFSILAKAKHKYKWAETVGNQLVDIWIEFDLNNSNGQRRQWNLNHWFGISNKICQSNKLTAVYHKSITIEYDNSSHLLCIFFYWNQQHRKILLWLCPGSVNSK